MTSIRTQLLFRLILVAIILVGGSAWFGYQHVRFEARELFDAQLARSARLILSLAQAQQVASGFSKMQEYLDESGLAVMYIDFGEKPENQHTEPDHIYETKLAFQIWDSEGNLVVKSYNAPIEPMAVKKTGFNTAVFDNFEWRTFSLISINEQYHCITAEKTEVRNDLIFKISNDLFYMFILLIPALTLILYLSIDQGLRPLQQLAAQINRRGSDNLELIANDTKFTEIVTIKNALNQLLRRLKQTLAREQRITSDAAHELRTPLAAIRLHTELAKNTEDLQEKNESLDHVIQAVDRTTHLVEQLLALARLEPELLVNDFTEVNLSTLIIEECALLSPLALDKKIEISFDDRQAEQIMGHRPSLQLLVRNILTNAISYTPTGGEIYIRLDRQNQMVTLTIQDNGPGIPEKDLRHVTERFYRAASQETPGCGIGLSIVDRVVQMHQGTLQLTQADSGQGLKVAVHLNIR